RGPSGQSKESIITCTKWGSVVMARRPLGIWGVLGGLLIGFCGLGGCDARGPVPPQPEGSDSTFVNSIGIRFRRLPAGTFRMGSATGQADEQPVHTVTITEPFYMALYEVTQVQWGILMEQDPSHFRGPHRPVDSVSWRQARTFIDRLNEKEETDLYRLPTEAEWEYAVRGRTETRYHFGKTRDSLRNYAWYSFNSERRTHRVGRKLRNPFGLYDMYGNVWEWVRDAYSPNFYERSARVDPLNTGKPLSPRVIRGGGWYSVVSDMRSANRSWARPKAQNVQLGFRIVREIPEDEQ
ncbi:MAG: formylglycine-generating enzyme family protein, partial [Salinibacter sp.]